MQTRVLAFDPGAKRCGWACLDDHSHVGPDLAGSGVFGLERRLNGKKKEEFQKYRLRLLPFFVESVGDLIDEYAPQEIVTEIVPAVGGGNFIAATQSELAKVLVTVVQVIAYLEGIEISQVSAGTVKRNIGGKKDATKVAVRNGVFKFLPELAERKGEWTKLFDEPDAIAVGLCHLGYKQ
jgi:Holliday junction resolvasome RuvABC endonuclease subunit